MGITIHYRGKLRDPASIPVMMEEMKEICTIHQWKFKTIPSSPGRKAGSRNSLEGIVFTIAERCDPVMFIFNPAGTLDGPLSYITEEDQLPWQFVKTQFAGAEAHIALCILLEYFFNRYFETFEVLDEGKFWETRDRPCLEASFDRVTAAIDTIQLLVEDLKIKGEKGENIVNSLIRFCEEKGFTPRIKYKG